MAARQGNRSEAAAWVDGAPALPEDAAAAAARILAASRQPLIAGLGVDVDGARAAVALAERVGGVVDHMHSAALLRDLDSLRETGVMVTTPGEARVRADLVLLVGDGLPEAWPALAERLLKPPARPHGEDVVRRIIWLAPNSKAKIPEFGGAIETFAVGPGVGLAVNLAALRALVKGRPLAGAALRTRALHTIAAALRAAKFGVAVWTATSLDSLEIEMLNGLVRDLNETTRFSTLPIAPPDNGSGVLSACGWVSGFPMRTGFGSGWPTHDAWRFDAERLVASKETDCVMWISAMDGSPPRLWGAPAIALCSRATRLSASTRVRIAVGRPGVDHDAVLHCQDAGALVAVAATSPSDGAPPSAAQALASIAAQLPDAGAWAC
jgi:formylmethanofuran dehydrogenase subunit B